MTLSGHDCTSRGGIPLRLESCLPMIRPLVSRLVLPTRGYKTRLYIGQTPAIDVKLDIFGDVNVISPPRYRSKYQAVSSRSLDAQQNPRRCPPPAGCFSLSTCHMRPTRRRWWMVGAAAATVGTLVGAAPRRPVSCDFICKARRCQARRGVFLLEL